MRTLRRPATGMLLVATLLALISLSYEAPPGEARHPRSVFGPPVTLFDGEWSSAPALAVDAAGRAVAVWTGSGGPVRAATRDTRGRWSPVRQLAPADGTIRYDAAVAIGRKGEAVAVWTHWYGFSSSYEVESATLSPSGSWSTPVTLGSDVSAPRLAMSPSGEAILAWTSAPGRPPTHLRTIQGLVRDSRGAWSAPIDLTRDDTQAGDHQVAMNEHGRAAVIWTEYAAPGTVVRSARWRPHAGWSPATDVEPSNGHVALQPEVRLDRRGEAVAIWIRWVGAGYVVRAASRAPWGAWSAATTLQGPADNLSTPHISVTERGVAHAIWAAWHSSGSVVRVASRPPRGPWSGPTSLTPTQGMWVSFPHIAATDRGAVAVWSREGETDATLQGAIARGSWWTENVDVSGPGDAGAPSIALGEQGAGAVAWRLDTAGTSKVQVADVELDRGNPGWRHWPGGSRHADRKTQSP